MIALVTGGAASGKSEYAENLVIRLGEGPRIYLATMEAQDGESLARVERHRLARAGKGFSTVECPRDLDKLPVPEGATVLLECLPNLLANEMYPAGKADPVSKILSGLWRLADGCAHLVVVSGEVFSEPVPAGMEGYVRALGELHRELAHRAELAAESVCGIPVYLKKPKGWAE